MNLDYYKPIPWGNSIPLSNPYAFSVSMPTIQSVIEYEEESKISKEVVKYAYPRIVFHPYIEQVLDVASVKLNLKRDSIFLLPDLRSGKIVSELSKCEVEFYDFHCFTVAFITDSKKIPDFYAFMKHCGYTVFDREAEDLLISLGLKKHTFNEVIKEDGDEEYIKNILIYGYGKSEIFLSNCGMNGIYSGFQLVKNIQSKKKRELFIIYGWAYSDSLQIFKKCTKEYIIIPDVSDTHELEEILKKRGSDVAAIYLETVSNPVIAVPDIKKVYDLSTKYDFLVLVDNTFATPWSVNIGNLCDIIFESLTKYASGQGDLMAGAVIFPETTRISMSSIVEIEKYRVPLYPRVVKRLAYSITDYKSRIEQVNSNAKKLVKNLGSMIGLKHIYSVEGNKNWDKIKKDDNSFCGVVSVVFDKPVESVYDSLNLPKGPSLGTVFPLVMPYTLLAHYQELKSEEGRADLEKAGLFYGLLRISVGTDDSDLIIKALQ